MCRYRHQRDHKTVDDVAYLFWKMIERAEAVIRVETEVDELLFGDLAYGWMGLLVLDRCQSGVLVIERAGHLRPSYSPK